MRELHSIIATSCLLLLWSTGNVAPVHGFFFDFLDSLSPTKIVDSFKEIIINSRHHIQAEIDAHKEVIAQLEAMKAFTVVEEKKLEDMASSITSLIMDLPNLFGKIKGSSDALVKHLKTLNELHSAADEYRGNSFIAADEVLKRLRDILKALNAAPADLPPLVFEIMGPQLRGSVHHGLLGEGEELPPSGNERDIFDKAFQLQKQEKFHASYELFMESWRAYNETEAKGLTHSLDLVYILDYVQYTAFKTGKITEALQVCNILLNRIKLTDEQKTRFSSTAKYYEQEIASESLKEMAKQIDNEPVEKQIEMANSLAATKQYDYCREDNARAAKAALTRNPKLYCRLSRRNKNPILMYAPIKEEFISLDPIVVVMYDMILPAEVQMLKDLATTKLSVAGVVNASNYGTEVQLHTRKARTAWIDTSMMTALTTRLEAYTGMNPYDDGCEMYQVGHYKIGGHYMPHYDTLFEASKESGLGDRIATLLLYLNTPEQGGGTVFTDLKVRVDAKEAAGLFWYNFHKNETADMRTMHGACPVIRGEKWVVNKWYRWRGQLLYKPTGKTEMDTFTMADYVLPPAVRKIQREKKDVHPDLRVLPG